MEWKSGTSRDLAEAFIARVALENSEERYRLLSESIPGTTWTARPDGRLDAIIEDPADTTRRPIATRLGDAWLEGVHPDDRERVRETWYGCVASGLPYDIEFRVRRADGNHRWQLVRALPQRDDGGAIVRWVGVNIDIDERVRADQSREMFVTLAESSNDFISIADPDRKVVYMNRAALDVLGLESIADARGRSIFDIFTEQDGAFVRSAVAPAIERDGSWAGPFRFRNLRSGALIPVDCNVFRLDDAAGKLLGYATISRDVSENVRIETGMRMLAEAGAAIYDSLDYDQTLDNIARVVARTFATFCAIDTFDAGGSLHRAAIAHARPESLDLIVTTEGEGFYEERPWVVETARFGTSICISEFGTDPTSMSANLRAIVERLGARSLISVPVRAPDGTVFGALTCWIGGDDPRPAYVEADLVFAEELGRRAGMAVAHARTYERERRVAERFQEAALPRVLPSSGGLALWAAYRPSKREAAVGGDWYDAFALDDGRIMITIGDVLGKGLDAAVIMAQVRQAMRSAATLVPEPNAVLVAADHAVREAGETYATALAGIFDPRTNEFLFASAGHAGPLVRRPDGRIEEYNAVGTLLGYRSIDPSTIVTISTPPGSMLAFFTDGLTEATRDIDQGYERLRTALADPRVYDAPDPAWALVDDVVRGEAAADDIAVLVAAVRPDYFA